MFQASYDFTALLPVEEQPVPVIPKVQKRSSPARTVRLSKRLRLRPAIISVLFWTIYCEAQSLLLDQRCVRSGSAEAFGEGGNGVGYPGFTYDATGRFVYARLTKKF